MEIITNNPMLFQKRHLDGIKAVLECFEKKGATKDQNKGPSAPAKRARGADAVREIITANPNATRNQMVKEANMRRGLPRKVLRGVG